MRLRPRFSPAARVGAILLFASAVSTAAFCARSGARSAAGSSPLAADAASTTIRVTVGGALFTTYKFDPGQKYPYFWPVCGPLSGRSLTTESSQPYPHHHSLFFGCDKVNGWNFWQDANERGQIVSHGAKVVENSPDRIVIEDSCEWRAPGRPAVMRDKRKIVIRAPSPRLRLVDFHIRLLPLVEVRIKRTNHSLFSVRVEPRLSVKGGGRLVNAEGLEGEKATWGQRSAWCDYSGDNGGVVEGIAIFDHPANPWFPSPWFTRDYGFFSPTPMYWLPRGELTLPRGEPLVLHYRVVVHAGDSRGARLADLFDRWQDERFSNEF